MTEAQLIQRLQDGDQTVARTLYEAHVDRIFRLCYRFAGEYDLAQDFTQETFVQAFTRIGSFRGEAKFGTWVAAIATNVSLNQLRKVKRLRDRQTELDERIHAVNPSRRIEPDLRADLHRAIDALPEGCRTVFLLHDVEGYTHSEIGAILGIQTGTSKSQAVPRAPKAAQGSGRARRGVGIVSDFERFTEFLRREARGYNEAARVPAEVMWGGVEAGLGEGDGVAAVGAGLGDEEDVGRDAVADREVDGRAIDALGYNDAPPAPRAEMWGRIEAAWGLRGGGVVGEGQSGIGEGAEGVVPGLPAERPGAWRWPSRQRWPTRRGVAGWAAALAAAASLVLGIALGRDARPTRPGEVGADPVFATVPTEAVAPSPIDVPAPQPALPAEPEPPVVAASILPLPGASVDLRAPAIPVEFEPQVVRFTDATLTARTAGLPSSLTFRRDRETIRFLGRTETLLTAFRTDQRTPLTERDLAVWGRELLIETRMHLDLQVSRTPEELALLQDLELVMLQISRLGSGAPDVEWQLAREGMEFKSALPRVRAAAAADGL